MSVVAWIVLGLIAGFIASKIVNRQGAGILLDLVVGIVIGGWVMTGIAGTGLTGFNLWSVLVAVIGAVVLLLLVNGIRRAT